MTVTTDCALLD